MTLRVVKVGTSLLRQRQEASTADAIAGLSYNLAESMRRGDRTVLVSSGAVGLGCQRLGMSQRPLSLPGLQAAASVGQGYLMSLYEKAFSQHSIAVAQILLTRADLADRLSYHNASATLNQLLEWGVLPVVNGNDTVSSDELNYGDNDTLSALVAAAVKADELILLTDVDSLYSADPRSDTTATPIKDVHDPEQIGELEEGAGSGGRWGTGGWPQSLPLLASPQPAASRCTSAMAANLKRCRRFCWVGVAARCSTPIPNRSATVRAGWPTHFNQQARCGLIQELAEHF